MVSSFVRRAKSPPDPLLGRGGVGLETPLRLSEGLGEVARSGCNLRYNRLVELEEQGAEGGGSEAR